MNRRNYGGNLGYMADACWESMKEDKRVRVSDYLSGHDDPMVKQAGYLMEQDAKEKLALKEENQRLRDVLQRIADDDYNDCGTDPDEWACAIAKAALEGE